MNNSKEGIDQVELESEKRKIDEREKQSFKERFRLSENWSVSNKRGFTSLPVKSTKKKCTQKYKN